jgi:excisionase family DNA binding protein
MQDRLRNLPDKTWFRPDEVARYFNVSRRTVERWHDTGRLQGVRFAPKVLRFHRRNIVAFESNATEAAKCDARTMTEERGHETL